MPIARQDSQFGMEEQEDEDVRFVDDFSDDEGFNESIEQDSEELFFSREPDISDNGLDDLEDEHIFEEDDDEDGLDESEYGLDDHDLIHDEELRSAAGGFPRSVGGLHLDATASRILRQLAPGLHVNRVASNSEDASEAQMDPLTLRRMPQFPTLRSFLDDAMQSTMYSPRVEDIVSALRSGDDSSIISGLTDLNEVLLLPQDSIFGFPQVPVDSVARPLVTILTEDHSIEVQVMTARAISQLIDNNPGSTAARCFVLAGIVPAMRKLFENVFYIDLIEQLIHVVKPVAFVEPKLVLTSGCINPCISTLEFFNEHIQREIMASVETCTKVVDSHTFEEACTMLAMFPECPNDLVIGAYSSLLAAIARCDHQNIENVITPRSWRKLLRYIRPNSPYLSRLMRAAAHIAARCPTYVSEIGEVSKLVINSILPGEQRRTDELYSRMINVSKDILFGGLKLLRVMLPFPEPVGSFVGPYRRKNHYKPNIPVKTIIEYSRNALPLAMCAYSVTTNASVRQLAILVVIQVIAALRPHCSDEVAELFDELRLVPFSAEVVAEGKENLALTVGGFEMVYELIAHPKILNSIRDSGLICDLEQHIISDSTVEEPHGQFGLGDDLTPVASYMASLLIDNLNKLIEEPTDFTKQLVENIEYGSFEIQSLCDAPLPNLIRSGVLEALNKKDVKTLLSDQFVNLIQSAITRLEKFDLQLSGSRASSLEDVISRVVYLRIVDKQNARSDRSWSATVPAFATLETIEDFVRSRLMLLNTVLTNEPNENNECYYNYDLKINFYANNVRLPRDISVLKAISGQSGTPIITYEVATHSDDTETEVQKDSESDITGPIAIAFEILRKLAIENEQLGGFVSWEKFRSAKLTAKLNRQLADIMSVCTSMLPQWTFSTVQNYPFLYPLKVRLHFVQLTSFGMGRNLRLLRRMHQESHDQIDDDLPDIDETSNILGRHKRQKFRISRDSILENGLQLLEHSSESPAIIEVMFTGEEGTGKGPTQEFFALISQALSDLKSGMWVSTASGLYPKPNKHPSPQILRAFKGIGVLIARALLDKRILDFQFNPGFFEAILNESGPSISKLRRVDAELANSLDRLLDSSDHDILSMHLDFVIPGTNIALIDNGDEVRVTSENAGDYVDRLCDYYVGSGIRPQIEAFRSGFSSTIPVSTLKSFMFDELSVLCGGDRDEDWSCATLRDAFNADHGYNIDSAPVQQLISTLSDFKAPERRKFLVFATGSPHLPVGGFKALRPPFTVVVKHPDNESLDNDQYLPSVMTCANYFKLPIYSSKEVLRNQLLVAMNEGCGSFPLS